MGYRETLEAAGAEVIAFAEFGSYQGDWYAKVKYNGVTGWIRDYYGSCSGCDAFESEFGWEDPTHEELADFGKRYLDGIMTTEDALNIAEENLSWDIDAQDAVDFIKENV